MPVRVEGEAPSAPGPQAFQFPDKGGLPDHLRQQMVAVAEPYIVRRNANGDVTIGNSQYSL